MEYEDLLKKARKESPKVTVVRERFELPKVSGMIQGNKTIVTNFTQICTSLGRDPLVLLKYLQKELATPAQIDGQRLILGRKINSASINSKIEQFTKDFVLCKECGKPDTRFVRENRLLFLRCTACGAKHPIKVKL